MGLIGSLIATLFGGDRNVVRDVAEVFRPNAEAGARRAHDIDAATLRQFAAEFQHPRKGAFDRLVDALNRLPRPALAFGTIALFAAAMVDPLWFGERMAGLALVPEPLWWLMGAIVSFYFGARHQAKAQDFQQSVAATVAATPAVVANVAAIRGLRSDSPGAAVTHDAHVMLTAVQASATDNAALDAILRRPISGD
jgi:hypothetical protein